MSSDGRLGKGTKLYIADADGTTFHPIVQLMEVGMPEREAKEVKITNQDSPDFTEEYIAGLSDGADSKVEYLWTGEAEAILAALYRKKRNMRIVYPKRDGTEPTSESGDPRHDLVGFVKKLGGKAPVDDKMVGEFTLRVCSAPVLTAES